MRALTPKPTLAASLRNHSRAAIRGLIDAVRLIPEVGELKIEIYVELTTLITLAKSTKTNTPEGVPLGCK